MDNIDVAHLAGIFDAIGTVTVNVTRDRNYGIGYRYRPLVRIQRSGKADDLMIGKFLAYCEDEGVNPTVTEEAHTAGDGTSVIMTIDDPDDIERFLEPLLEHLTTKFEPALILLEDVLPTVREGDHRTKDGFYDLMDAADALRSFNNKGSDPKYTKAFFAEKWSDEMTGTA